jgi:hypothetical protein
VAGGAAFFASSAFFCCFSFLDFAASALAASKAFLASSGQLELLAFKASLAAFRAASLAACSYKTT